MHLLITLTVLAALITGIGYYTIMNIPRWYVYRGANCYPGIGLLLILSVPWLIWNYLIGFGILIPTIGFAVLLHKGKI